MSYAQLAEECFFRWQAPYYLCAAEDSVGHLFAVTMSLSDLRDAIDDGDPEEMGRCSAQASIAALRLLHLVGYDRWASRERMHDRPRFSPSEIVEPARRYVSMAHERWLMDRKDALVCVELIVHQIADMRTHVLKLPNDLATDVRSELARARTVIQASGASHDAA